MAITEYIPAVIEQGSPARSVESRQQMGSWAGHLAREAMEGEPVDPLSVDELLAKPTTAIVDRDDPIPSSNEIVDILVFNRPGHGSARRRLGLSIYR